MPKQWCKKEQARHCRDNGQSLLLDAHCAATSQPVKLSIPAAPSHMLLLLTVQLDLKQRSSNSILPGHKAPSIIILERACLSSVQGSGMIKAFVLVSRIPPLSAHRRRFFGTLGIHPLGIHFLLPCLHDDNFSTSTEVL